jgi:hypothetical protein
MNLAETGHSTWAKSGACNLTLVDAARHDVGENIRLEKIVEGFLDGSVKSTGKGPSSSAAANRDHATQMARARDYGKEILDPHFEGDPYCVTDVHCDIDPSASHSPTKRTGKSRSVNPGKPKRRSKYFLARLEKAKSEAGEMYVSRTVSIASDYCRFVLNHESKSYFVDINLTPRCSCPDFGKKDICKHLVWVYLFALNVDENNDVLERKTLTLDVLASLLQNTTSSDPRSNPSGKNVLTHTRTTQATSTLQCHTSLSQPNTLPVQSNASSLQSHTSTYQRVPAPIQFPPNIVTQPGASNLYKTRNPFVPSIYGAPTPPSFSSSSTTFAADPFSQIQSNFQLPILGFPQSSSWTSPSACKLPRPDPGAGQFILALLSQCHPLVSVCFGCSGTLKQFGRIPTEPQDLVLATQMKRPFIHEGEKRERMAKVYIHASVQCVRRKDAYFDPRNILIPPAIIMNLTKSHKIVILHTFGIAIP